MKSKHAINDVNEPYQSEDADLTMISSDAMHFKVDSYHLMAASPVFRDMVHLGRNVDQQREVEFTDRQIETGAVIRLFLDVCYHSAVEVITADKEAPCKNLIRFLIKYDCYNLLEKVRLTVQSWLHGQVDPTIVFRIATRLDNDQLALEGDDDATKLRKEHLLSIPMTSVLDPAGMGYAKFSSIPKAPLYALLRATRQIGTTEIKFVEWDKVAQEYEAVMRSLRHHKAV
ncbi:hypothetical protein IAU60_005678 [Kwoniella sp. DSM 27419]